MLNDIDEAPLSANAMSLTELLDLVDLPEVSAQFGLAAFQCLALVGEAI